MSGRLTGHSLRLQDQTVRRPGYHTQTNALTLLWCVKQAVVIEYIIITYYYFTGFMFNSDKYGFPCECAGSSRAGSVAPLSLAPLRLHCLGARCWYLPQYAEFNNSNVPMETSNIPKWYYSFLGPIQRQGLIAHIKQDNLLSYTLIFNPFCDGYNLNHIPIIFQYRCTFP